MVWLVFWTGLLSVLTGLGSLAFHKRSSIRRHLKRARKKIRKYRDRQVTKSLKHYKGKVVGSARIQALRDANRKRTQAPLGLFVARDRGMVRRVVDRVRTHMANEREIRRTEPTGTKIARVLGSGSNTGLCGSRSTKAGRPCRNPVVDGKRCRHHQGLLR